MAVCRGARPRAPEGNVILISREGVRPTADNGNCFADGLIKVSALAIEHHDIGVLHRVAVEPLPHPCLFKAEALVQPYGCGVGLPYLKGDGLHIVGDKSEELLQQSPCHALPAVPGSSCHGEDLARVSGGES